MKRQGEQLIMKSWSPTPATVTSTPTACGLFLRSWSRRPISNHKTFIVNANARANKAESEICMRVSVRGASLRGTMRPATGLVTFIWSFDNSSGSFDSGF